MKSGTSPVKKVLVKLEGTRPILINKFTEEPVTNKPTRGKKDYGTPVEQAAKTAYTLKDGTLVVPSSWISGSMKNAASIFKMEKSRKTYKSISGSAIVLTDEFIKFKGQPKLTDLEVDSRGVRIQNARIMRHRAKLTTWGLEFEMLIDSDLMPVEAAEAILVEAGRTQGIGDFRINKGGPFGGFVVTEFTQVDG